MNKNIFYIFLLLLILVPTFHAAELTNFDITIDIRSPQKAFVKEVWSVEYSEPVSESKKKFKEKILEANIDLEKFSEIDPKLKPNVFLRNFSNVTINFDESNDKININYEISEGVILQNFYETEDEILWQFNQNLLRNFIINNLFVVPFNSRLTIQIYDPLRITDTNPTGQITRNTVFWEGISSNEIKLLAYEKKPPKPSFVIISSQETDIFYYLILVLIILISIILIFKEPLEKVITKFVVKNSVIKPKKTKKDFVFDQDVFED